MTKVEYALNASGVRFQVEETPIGHWRATQAEKTENNYAGIPASFTAPTRKRLLQELQKHYSN